MKAHDMWQDIQQVLLDEETLQNRVAEMAETLTQDYADKDLLMVGVLKGAVVFFSQLALRMKIPVSMDFISVSSYGASSESSGVVRILKDLDTDITGKDVLLVEDIVDTGLTLTYLKEILQTRQPASLKIASLLDKPSRRKVELTPDYCGFYIPDVFVVGWGLDYNGNYRNLPVVGELKKEVYECD